MYILFLFFFFNDTATTEIYTLSLHDALPISPRVHGSGVSNPARTTSSNSGRPARRARSRATFDSTGRIRRSRARPPCGRSEEHTSELQSRPHLVCRLLLEKKKIKIAVQI